MTIQNKPKTFRRKNADVERQRLEKLRAVRLSSPWSYTVPDFPALPNLHKVFQSSILRMRPLKSVRLDRLPLICFHSLHLEFDVQNRADVLYIVGCCVIYTTNACCFCKLFGVMRRDTEINSDIWKFRNHWSSLRSQNDEHGTLWCYYDTFQSLVVTFCFAHGSKLHLHLFWLLLSNCRGDADSRCCENPGWIPCHRLPEW